MARNSGGFMEGHDEEIGKGEFANLPQDVKMKAYPKNRGMDTELDDTMSDIDDIADEAEGVRRRYVSNQK